MTDHADKVLIVDDSKSICALIGASINQLGYPNCQAVQSGKEALALVAQPESLPDLILVDLNMPDMDGMELIRLISLTAFSGAVIIISALNNRIIDLAVTLAQSHKIKVIGSIEKPLAHNKLIILLDKYKQCLANTNPNLAPLSKLELLTAFAENRVIPYYQPKVDTAKRVIHSIEVLARIQNPHSGVPYLPCQFIEVAEDEGLINLLTYQLVEKCSKEFAMLRQILGSDVKMSINLSPSQLEELDCPDILSTIIAQHQIPPSDIIFEVTEEHILNTTKQLETLNRLRIRGFGAALDDFGTGFTNIQQLKNMPFTEIKIDRSLIFNIHEDVFPQVIVNTLAKIAQNYDFDLVAEGIESFDEIQYLQDKHPQILHQGYFICKPKPANDLLLWYKSWNSVVLSNQSAL